MDKSKIENAINHIISLQERLCYCENNLQYYWCDKNRVSLEVIK